VFIATVFFFYLECMLVNWCRLLISGLLQWVALLSTALISTWVCFTIVHSGATLLCRAGYMLGFATQHYTLTTVIFTMDYKATLCLLLAA